MATYKVIQDVEAEDKILGPLTLKQLIFAIIAVGFGFGAFRMVTLFGSILAIIPFLPFIIVFGALAAPIGKTQPTEVWLAAQVHFFTKPKIRLWDQKGLKQLVNITAPKTIQKNYTDGLSQNQVQSRLKALASTLDSHGWALKNNIDPTAYIGPNPDTTDTNDDRLVETQVAPVATEEPRFSDIFATDNPEAQEVDDKLKKSEIEHRNQIEQIMEQARQQTQTAPQNQTQQEPTQLNNTSDQATLESTQTTPVPAQPNLTNPNDSPKYTSNSVSINEPPDQQTLTQEEQALYNKILEQKHNQTQSPNPNYNHRVVQPLTNQDTFDDSQPAQNDSTASEQADKSQAPDKDKDIISKITKSPTKNIKNDTITKDANAYSRPKRQQPDEVVIQLH